MAFSSLEELIESIKTNKALKFKIKVIAGSSVDSIDFSEEFIKIKIKQRAIEGKANKAIINFLSDVLKMPKTKIKILNGERASIKTIQVIN